MNVYDDAEMEDTPSSSVRFLGKTVPGSSESSLGLTPTDVPTVELSRSVTGLCTAETRDQRGADTPLAARAAESGHMNAPAPSGLHVVTSTRVNEQRTIVQNAAGISDELRTAQQQMAEQRVEMEQSGTITDDMIDRVG